MANSPFRLPQAFLCLLLQTLGTMAAVNPVSAESHSLTLPKGVTVAWDLERAYHEVTPTRERVCLNGLWQWQPAGAPSAAETPDTVPSGGWGYFKVPGCWPGITDYMQKDCQSVFAHPNWQKQSLSRVNAAWYQREFGVPAEWASRRITLTAEYLNSHAIVFVDGAKAGKIRFPSGELDLTSVCRPGNRHVLSMLVTAMPLKGVMLSYTDSASAREVKGSVARRGLCGDVYLVSTPTAARLGDVKVDTSVRKWEITVAAVVEAADPAATYALRMRLTDVGRQVAEFMSGPFRSADLEEGRFAFTSPWHPQKLWDTDTPGNLYGLEVTLLDAAGKPLDTAWPVRFGFREFWIDGRDFYLNGTRIFLSALPADNAQVGAAWASYEGAKESFRRLQSFGINFVYTHNYDCEPGSHMGFAEILRAADDTGMLVALTQPHFSHYDWKTADADAANGYAGHARFYAGAAGNHPSVVAYSMSHNACGYTEDMNPDLIDGVHAPRDWSANNAKLALRAEAIVKHLDSERIVYHHAGGNLGSMHTANFYANFAPVQEMSDWFEHWATQGTKPMFTCEYSVPFSWDWTMYRGWYKDQREFGSAAVPWEYCLAEWNSQFLGARAFQISDAERANLRWEAKQAQAGKVWHRWDYPYAVGSTRLMEQYPVVAMYISDNWRAFRTWGLSAKSPWDCAGYWRLRDGVDKGRKQLPVDWQNLQRPGYSADYVEDRYQRMDLAYEAGDWIPTPAADALYRNNLALLAYIAGKPSAFTSKDHNFLPGDAIEKQLILINNSRRAVSAECEWSLALPQAVTGGQSANLPTGEQQRIPLRFTLPGDLKPGQYKLTATVRFTGAETQTDTFTMDVLPRPAAVQGTQKIALFDPPGETAKLLSGLGMRCDSVDADADLSAYDLLIIGKGALTLDGPAPNATRVRDGLKVILFEQTAEVLEKRLGFRVAEYGLRQVYERIPGHPLLEGLSDEQLHDWAGASTILPPRLKYEVRPRQGITVRWCDIPETRLWRCGNRGNVASVLIEKPACGDFLPIVDGGYSLQYSPLMEYREGRGMVLFCQLDVTGRTEPDPAADALFRNVVRYVGQWKPAPHYPSLYVGDPAGRSHITLAGFATDPYSGGDLPPNRIFIAGPGAATQLTAHAPAIAAYLKAGGKLLAIGQTGQEASTFLPTKLSTRKAEHIAAFFDPLPPESPLAGVSPADVHNRDPRELPLFSADGGVRAYGDGVLASATDGNIVFCQLTPWEFDPQKYHLKRTYRRTSFLLSRLLGNMGAASSTPLLGRIGTPVSAAKPEQSWLEGLYLDRPEEWDDPYRFFRW